MKSWWLFRLYHNRQCCHKICLL